MTRIREQDDEDPILGPAGFIFQTPVRARRHRGDSGGAGRSADRAARRSGVLDQVRRVVARRPEVMVKVSGASKGRKHLREHLAYITRNGELSAERENGETIRGPADVREVASEWWALRGVERKANARDTINLILSMPAGTDRDKLAAAAGEFAAAEFAGHFDYLLVHHADTSHPHAHLTVRAVGFDGRVLNPRKADLQHWREEFATALRSKGVHAEATPRRARGVTRKGQRQSVRHLDARKASTVTRAKIDAAIATLKRGTSPKAATDPWEQAYVRRHAETRAAWSRLSKALEAVGDVALAVEVNAFADALPKVTSEREALAAKALELLERTQQTLPRDRGR